MVSRLIDGIRDYVSPPLDEGEDTEEPDSTTPLFTCRPCGETFIADEMDVCPRCGEAVERTPSFDELGIRTGCGR